MIRLLCLLCVLLPRLVLASCEAEGLSVWPPPGQALPVNGQLVLQGYGLSQEPVARIAEHSPQLVTEGDEVPLHVIALHRGEFRLTQAVLQPERQLLAEVRRAEGGTPVRFRLKPMEGKVRIGHGMCSGGFKLQEGMRYTVRLVAVDMAGNESVAPGDEVLIEGPQRD